MTACAEAPPLLAFLPPPPTLPAPGRARRRALGFGLCLLALTATVGAGGPARRASPITAEHAAARRPAIAEALRDMAPGAVLLAGNSHAEMAGRARLPCAPLVDAGLAGARANEVAAGLAGLRAGARARLGVLILGTNDILRAADPLSGEARARFAAEAGSALAWLRANARDVIVAALPPIGAAAAGKRDPAAVAVYSEILRDLCRPGRCRFADPFAGLRGDDPGLARPGALSDAIHLADYPAMLDALSLCPDRGPALDPPKG